MALVDDLLARIPDRALRAELSAAVDRLRQTREFGLVFEEHIPETTSLWNFPIREGDLVELRAASTTNGLHRVESISSKGRSVTITPLAGPSEPIKVTASKLLVVKPFGEPLYPSLSSLGTVGRGGTRPHHAVIDGENFHALQLLIYLYEGQVDCIYIDPPYNTGARDWKYNNRYVDSNDRWQHSKWLSMMERRLKLASSLSLSV